MTEFHFKTESLRPIRTSAEITRDGGHCGAKIVHQGRTGEQAIQLWEQTHGKLAIPAYKRRGSKRHFPREAFAEN